MPETIVIEGLSNAEFFERFAQPGRIGLVGGTHITDRLISRAQSALRATRTASDWSHAFVFQGRRVDGHHWIIESDVDIRQKHIRLGVQENRIAKYCDETKHGAVAVIDLGLTEQQVERLVVQALDLVAAGTRYSLREIVGTAWAMRNPAWRPKENLLAREQAFYCSSFVRHVCQGAGVNLGLGMAVKNTTPEDLAQISVPHRKWIMVRAPGSGP